MQANATPVQLSEVPITEWHGYAKPFVDLVSSFWSQYHAVKASGYFSGQAIPDFKGWINGKQNQTNPSRKLDEIYSRLEKVHRRFHNENYIESYKQQLVDESLITLDAINSIAC